MSAYSYTFMPIEPDKSPFLLYSLKIHPAEIEPDIDPVFPDYSQLSIGFRNEFLYHLKHDIFVQREQKLEILAKLPDLSYEQIIALMNTFKGSLIEALDMKIRGPAELNHLVSSAQENWQQILKIWNDRRDSEIAAARAESMFAKFQLQGRQPHNHPICTLNHWFDMYRVSINMAERRLKPVWQ